MLIYLLNIYILNTQSRTALTSQRNQKLFFKKVIDSLYGSVLKAGKQPVISNWESLEVVTEKKCPPVDPWPGPSEDPYPSLVFEMYSLPAVSTLGDSSRDTGERMYFWDRLNEIHDSIRNHTSQGTCTHNFPTETTQLFSALTEVQVFMSRRRKNSARDREIGKKWIYLEDTCIYSPSHFLAFYGWTDLAPLGVSFNNR